MADVSVNEFLERSEGYGPTWLPRGFGLAHVRGEGDGLLARADSSDGSCREVSLAVESGNRDALVGRMVGRWTLTSDTPGGCSNAELGGARCLRYSIELNDMTLHFLMMGVRRVEGDRIVRSVDDARLSPHLRITSATSRRYSKVSRGTGEHGFSAGQRPDLGIVSPLQGEGRGFETLSAHRKTAGQGRCGRSVTDAMLEGGAGGAHSARDFGSRRPRGRGDRRPRRSRRRARRTGARIGSS